MEPNVKRQRGERDTQTGARAFLKYVCACVCGQYQVHTSINTRSGTPQADFYCKSSQRWPFTSAFWIKLLTSVLKFTHLVHVCQREDACISSSTSPTWENMFPHTGFGSVSSSLISQLFSSTYAKYLLLGSRFHPSVQTDARIKNCWTA